MRRLVTATVSAAVASLLVLTGCSGTESGEAASPTPSGTESASSGQAEPTAEDVAALDTVTLEGEPGSQPTVGFEPPFTVSAALGRVVSEGTGAPLEEGQKLALSVLEVSGEDGSQLSSTYGAEPFEFDFGPGTPPLLADLFAGQAVGARILLAAPAAESTVITALEVTGARTIPLRAEGAAVEPAPGLPTVTLAEDGAPSITPVDGDAPTELVIQPLITGTGPVVESGQNVTFQYSGWLWDGTSFDSSWENGAPFTTTIGTGSVIPGWDQGLVGQPVGSQVLLVIPPALGYGEEGQGTIPANATLVFVVDILDAA